MFNSLFVATPLGITQGVAVKADLFDALASGVSNVVGSVVNAMSQRSSNKSNERNVDKTNEMNYQLAQDANAQQQAQFDENMSWLREQFVKQREFALSDRDYNSPKKVVERLQSAGINPLFGFSNGQTSISPVSSVGAPAQSNFHVPTMQAFHEEPVMYGDALSSGVGSAVNAFYENQLKSESAKNVREQTVNQYIKNMFEFNKQVEELRNLRADYLGKLSHRDLTDAQRKHYQKEVDLLDKQIEVYVTTMDDLKQRPAKENALLDAQERHTMQQTALAEVNTRLSQMDLKLKPLLASAQIRLSNAQVNHLYQQARLVAEQVITQQLNSTGVRLSNIKASFENQLTELLLMDERYSFNTRESVRPVHEFTKEIGNWLFGGLRGVISIK